MTNLFIIKTEVKLETWLKALSLYMTPERLKNRWEFSIIILGFFFFFTLLEIIFSGWQKTSVREMFAFKKTNRWDFFSFCISLSGIQKILSNLFSLGLLGLVIIGMQHYEGGLFPEMPFWLRVIFAIITYDFLLYWTHRLMHENSFFWNLHVYHHSSTKVSIFSDYRVHPTDYLLYYPVVLSIIIFLFSREVQNSWAYAWIEIFPGLWAHSRIDTDFGWIGKYIVVSPRYHHLHHSKNLKMNTNYAHFFVIWDHLFGTYTEPEDSICDIEQGLKDNFFETQNPVKAFLAPVLNIYKAPFAFLRKK